MTGKRGSHVGVVVSFMIFVVFLIFIFLILQPATEVQKEKGVLLKQIENEIIIYTTAELISSSIKISDTFIYDDIGLDCVKIDQRGISEIKKSLVKDSDGNLVLSRFGFFDESLRFNVNLDGLRFFRIFYSEEFEEKGSVTLNCEEIEKDEDYNLGQTKVKDYVFESKISELNEIYFSDKESLREIFGVTLGSEFAFTFETSDEIIYGGEIESVTSNIYVDEVGVQYVDFEANIAQGKLKVFVW